MHCEKNTIRNKWKTRESIFKCIFSLYILPFVHSKSLKSNVIRIETIYDNMSLVVIYYPILFY